MFSFCFALIVLINLGVNGQNNQFNTVPSNTVDQASLFGRLHHLLENQVQISCYRIRANIKSAHPTDNTKYFVCRDEQRYEIFTCPNGGIFDDREKACIDLCEQKQPCLNQGQCIILANLTLECVCRRDWTGAQCEIPLSTCAQNPCGPNAECRMLKAGDYSQDYVCLCNNHQTYGRNCQQTVPNPCLTNTQQFHPFAFSRQAYINCDDELIFFQPCNANLYWSQEDKRCDRSLPLLLRAPFLNIRVQNQQQQNFRKVPQGAGTQQWSNQVGNNPSQSWQGSQTIQNQQPFTNNFVETTPSPPKTFHLTGFASKNSGQQNTQWQSNGNNQFQPSENFQTQSWQNSQSLNHQPMLTTGMNSQVPTSFSQNNQLGSTRPQEQTQWTPTSFETATDANKNVQQGLFVHSLRGWQSNQPNTLNSISTGQTRS